MRLKRFNVKQEQQKLNRKHNYEKNVKTRTVILSILVLVGSIMLFTYSSFTKTITMDVMHSKAIALNIENYYIDNVASNNPPASNSGYSAVNITCNNGATGTWDNDDWELIVSSPMAKNTCSIYFEIVPVEYEDDSGASKPELYQGLVPVRYNSHGDTVIADTTQAWYDYEEHEWANAVLVTSSARSKVAGQTLAENEILQYYVWIPRYKYKLWNAENGTSDEQMIEIEFQDKDDIKANGDSNGEWLTHPAFTFGTNELN